ncbi:hypothetical protein M885DRAFT_514579 [Pelagophyceae sp. CCMP2097]|nr:hypothetical protein M885DRAFT_514579 [Pelagophyceae sp. CCMP2097]
MEASAVLRAVRLGLEGSSLTARQRGDVVNIVAAALYEASPAAASEAAAADAYCDDPALRRAALVSALAGSPETAAALVSGRDADELASDAAVVLASDAEGAKAALFDKATCAIFEAAAAVEIAWTPSFEAAVDRAFRDAAMAMASGDGCAAAARLVRAVLVCLATFDGRAIAAPADLVEACAARACSACDIAGRGAALSCLVHVLSHFPKWLGAAQLWAALEYNLVKDDSDVANRRRALKLLQGCGAEAGAAWKSYAQAYAAAEFETSSHLFDQNAYKAITVAFTGHNGEIPTAWACKLLQRVLGNENPGVRKACLARCVRLDFFGQSELGTIPWDWVRDVLLSVLDDAVVRKSKQTASEIDAAATDFFRMFLVAQDAQTRTEIAKFASTNLLYGDDGEALGAKEKADLLCHKQEFGTTARAVVLSVFSSADDSIALGIDFRDGDVLAATAALRKLQRVTNRAVTEHALKAVLNIALASTADISPVAAADLAGFGLHHRNVGPACHAWLRRVADAQAWVAALADDGGIDARALAAVAAAFLSADDGTVVKACFPHLFTARRRVAFVLCGRAVSAPVERRALWPAASALPQKTFEAAARYVATGGWGEEPGPDDDDVDGPSAASGVWLDVLATLVRLAPTDGTSKWVAWADLLVDACLDMMRLSTDRGDLAASARALAVLNCVVVQSDGPPVPDSTRRRLIVDAASEAVSRARLAKQKTRVVSAALHQFMWAIVAKLAGDGVAYVSPKDVVDALEACGTSRPALIDACRAAFATVSLLSTPETGREAEAAVVEIANAASRAFEDCDRIATPSMTKELLTCIIAPITVHVLTSPQPRVLLGGVLLDILQRLVELSFRRPHVSDALAIALCCAMREGHRRAHLPAADGTAANGCRLVAANWVPFAGVFSELVMHRPIVLKLDEISDEVDNEGDAKHRDGASSENGTVENSWVRLHCLYVLTDEVGLSSWTTTAVDDAAADADSGPRALVDAVCSTLMAQDDALRERTRLAAGQKSASWGQRLRLWQAVGVLSPLTSDAFVRGPAGAGGLASPAAILPRALASPTLPCVRYAIESASIVFARRAPSPVLASILDMLDSVREGRMVAHVEEVLPAAHEKNFTEVAKATTGCGRELAIASLLAVAGHAVIDFTRGPSVAHLGAAGDFGRRVLQASFALMSSARGLIRGVAQLLTMRLLQDLRVFEEDAKWPLEQLEEHRLQFRALAVALLVDARSAMLHDPDVLRGLKRQQRFFTELRSPDLATLRGVVRELGDGTDEGGPESLAHQPRPRNDERACSKTASL